MNTLLCALLIAGVAVGGLLWIVLIVLAIIALVVFITRSRGPRF